MFETTTYGELVNGDIVIIQGYRFVVRDLWRVPANLTAPVWSSQHRRTDVIRFHGHVADPASDIAGTGYDGGTYGAYADVEVARDSGV
jgi:hypothetical protein